MNVVDEVFEEFLLRGFTIRGDFLYSDGMIKTNLRQATTTLLEFGLTRDEIIEDILSTIITIEDMVAMCN